MIPNQNKKVLNNQKEKPNHPNLLKNKNCSSAIKQDLGIFFILFLIMYQLYKQNFSKYKKIRNL